MDKFNEIFFKGYKEKAEKLFKEGKSLKEIEIELSKAECPVNQRIDIIESLRTQST